MTKKVWILYDRFGATDRIVYSQQFVDMFREQGRRVEGPYLNPQWVADELRVRSRGSLAERSWGQAADAIEQM